MGQIVKENIEFKRGISSKEAMGVGSFAHLLPPFKFDNIPKGTYIAQAKEYNPGGNEGYETILRFGEGRILERLTMWLTTGENIRDPDFLLDEADRINETNMYSHDWWLKNENITSLKKIDWFNEVKESYEFKRGIGTKKSLNIGRKREIKNPTADQVVNLPEGTYLMESNYTPFFIVVDIKNDGKYFEMIHYNWDDEISEAIQKFLEKNYLYKENLEAYTHDASEIESFLESYDIISIKLIDLNANESYEFKRGIGTKKSLNIGREREIRNVTKDKIVNVMPGIYLLKSLFPPGIFAIAEIKNDGKHFELIMNEEGKEWDENIEGAISKFKKYTKTWNIDSSEITGYLEDYGIIYIKRMPSLEINSSSNLSQ